MNPLKMAYKNLRTQQKRSWLTIIGIFIGIMAVVALISLGQGLEQSITESFEEIGSDKLFIQLDTQFGGVGGGDNPNPLTDKDIEVVRDTPGINRATGFNIRSGKVEVGDEIGFYFIAGLPNNEPEDYDMLRQAFTVDIVDGREIRPGETGVAVVGFDYTKRSVFEKPLSVGDRVNIKDEQFTVIGINEALGNSADDRTIYISSADIREMYGIEDEVYMIIAQTDPDVDATLMGERVQQTLLDFRNLDEEDQDFSIQTPEDILASFGVILLIVRVVLVGIALISLLVGGVGIMNTMFTSVLERTKEIGIMKAIGATPRMIQNIFLAEAGMLGLVGGTIGMLLGLGISKGVEIITYQAIGADWVKAYISWWLIVGALLFSILVGMLAGYLPARAASRQDPVESLRYE